MTTAKQVIRALSAVGVRIELAGDRFKLVPAGVASDDQRQRLHEHRTDVKSIIEDLPAPDRCRICGDPTGWHDGKTLANCTHCALASAEQWLAERGIEMPPPLTPELFAELTATRVEE